MSVICIPRLKTLPFVLIFGYLFLSSTNVRTVGKELEDQKGASTSTANVQRLGIRVPFVGCDADGQVGPVKAPTDKVKVVSVTADAAKRLAYYKSEQGLGVLAPRGWYCFGVYGSSGYALYVSPQQISAANLFSTTWSGFTGPVIELLGENGDTSGRFGVAKIIASVFPKHRAFTERVIEEDKDIEPASSFPYGPYPGDKLSYRSNEIVEFQTPTNADGLGTYSGKLKKNTSPISGVAILTGETPDLLLLSVRLSTDPADLSSVIVQQLERDAANATHNQ